MKFIRNGFLGLVLSLLAVNPLSAYVFYASKWTVGDLTIYCEGNGHSDHSENGAQARATANAAKRLGAKVLIETTTKDYTKGDDRKFTALIRNEMMRHEQQQDGNFLIEAYKRCKAKRVKIENIETRHDIILLPYWEEENRLVNVGKACAAMVRTFQRLEETTRQIVDVTILGFCQNIIEATREKEYFQAAKRAVDNAKSYEEIGLKMIRFYVEKNIPHQRTFDFSDPAKNMLHNLKLETLSWTNLMIAVEIDKALKEERGHLIICTGALHILGHCKFAPGIHSLLEELHGTCLNEIGSKDFGGERPAAVDLREIFKYQQNGVEVDLTEEDEETALFTTPVKIGACVAATGVLGYLSYRAWQWWKSRS